jgi:hypothetical protein
VARNILFPVDYTFNPATKTITIPSKWVRPEKLVLITNVTKNTVIYNFSDSTRGYTSYTKIDLKDRTGLANSLVGTQIVLAYDTTSMSSTDYLSILIDENAAPITFDDQLMDPVQKLRVSTPQSLIDTDFEYGVQPNKWEALFLENNYPSFFPKVSGGNSLLATSIFGDGTSPRSLMTITFSVPHGLSAGQVVNVQETQNIRAEGTFLITSVPSVYKLTYRARGIIGGEVIYTNLSSVYGGDIFDNAHIPGGSYPGQGTISGAVNSLKQIIASTDGAPQSNITVTLPTPHGLFPGTPMEVNGTGGSWDGNYLITKVNDPYSFVLQSPYQLTAISVPSTTIVVAKSEGYIVHRPYDAGVALTTYNNTPGAQTIRQTRRNFRYQSGKAVQFSTGAKFTPTLVIDQISINALTSGSLATVTVKTQEDHGCQIGATILVENLQTIGAYNPFNGTFTITNILDSNILQYQLTLTQNLSATDATPSGGGATSTINMPVIHVIGWQGGATRAGMFDFQNGFYFEYDGQYLYACRRHSEIPLMGRATMTQNSPLVTGTNTQWRKQLVVGNNIVIKGSTYRVTAIFSDTQMYIAPAYRGPSQPNGRVMLTQDIRVRQDQWNYDKMDGTGPSGYTIDVARMQMIFIDYSWYGAGTVRWGMRGPNGKIIYCHIMPQNNTNPLAYQRSGNLPARYEVANDPLSSARMTSGPSGVLGSALSPNDTTLYVDKILNWASSGWILVKDDKAVEMMKYASIGSYVTGVGYPLTISARRTSQTIIFPDQPFTFSGTTTPVTFTPDSSFTGSGGAAQVSVQPITQTCAPIVQHWGSSVILDGRYDQDLLPIFTGGMVKYLSVPASTSACLMLLRVAPSVDNGIGRSYGYRELINRMQLNMKAIGIQTNGSFRVDVILNPGYISYTAVAASSMTLTRSSVTGTSGTNILTIGDTSGTVGITPGTFITSGANVPAGTYVTGVYLNKLTLSATLTGNASGSYVFTPAAGYTGLPNDWTRDSVGGTSLAQILYLDNAGPGAGSVAASATGYVLGGENIFSFFTENGGGASNYNASFYDLTGTRDIGNSTLSGDGNVSTPGFPNGPDILAIVVTNIGTSASNIAARISWTEAQA